MDEMILYTTLKSRLYLKMKANDSSYSEEMAQICEILPHSPRFPKDLRAMLISIARRPDSCSDEILIDVAERTNCISRELLSLHNSFVKLDGKPVDVQIEMLHSMINQPFPSDATSEDICNFYVECTNLAISICDNKLLEEIIRKMEELS